MANQIQTPECPHCGATLQSKEGKKGTFYSCPNWKKDGAGCEGIIWFPPKEKSKIIIQKGIGGGGNEEVLKALRELYKLGLETQKEMRDCFRMFADNK